jgi:hypothetical protein
MCYLYFKNQKKNFNQGMRIARENIRNLEKKTFSIRTSALYFSPEEPEPYGPLAYQINQELFISDINLKKLKELYAHAQTRLSALNHLAPKSILTVPALIKELAQDIENLQCGLDVGNRKLEELVSLSTKLQEAGWDIAGRCRKLLAVIQENLQELELVNQSDLGDERSDFVEGKLKGWESTLLSQIPAFFFSNVRALFEEKTDRDQVIAINRLLKPAFEEVDPLIDQVQNWKSELEKYRTIRSELLRSSDEISQVIGRLQKDPTLSIHWDESEAPEAKIIEQINHEFTVKRRVSALGSELRRLSRLSKQQNLIGERVLLAAKAHDMILSLTGKDRLSGLVSWTKSAMIVADGCKRYNPANWKIQNGIDHYQQRLQSLTLSLQNVSSRINSRKLNESELVSLEILLTQLFHEEGTLLSLHSELNNQYQKALALERESKETLLNLNSHLTQVESIVESNPYLKRKAGKFLTNLRAHLSSSLKDFNNPLEGLVEKKWKKQKSLITQFEIILKKWAQDLTEQITAMKLNLSKTMNILQDLVSLSDPVFVEIISLLKEKDSRDIPFNNQSPQSSMAAAAFELKVRSDEWHRITAANRTVEELSGPILHEYSKLEKNRQKLLEVMEKSDRVIPETLSWPPTTQRLTLERAKFKKLEEDFTALRVTRHKAIQLVSIFSDLHDRYRELSDTVVRIVDVATQEQNRITELTQRYQESKSMWSQRMAENNSNTTLVDEIRALLRVCERDYQELQKRYASGSVSYPQTLQMLKTLRRKLDDASFMVGQNQFIDSTGQIQRQI